MRGEDNLPAGEAGKVNGSPPHARGRLGAYDHGLASRRITPACAGKTGGGVLGWLVWGDHPRMRGEDVRLQLKLDGRQRITPACAGKTRRV